MYISYFDESGDDGFPDYSSELFVLSSVYMEHTEWKKNYQEIYNFRKRLSIEHNIPVKVEMHTKKFLLNKNPYKKYSMSDETRESIIDSYCRLISELDIKIVNVAIDKTKITTNEYNILDTSLTYSIQRIENDLLKMKQDNIFMLITDEGRVGKMRSTTRRIQKLNYIPSKYKQQSYRQEIKTLIEDPLPKNSKESYFIQLSDLIAYIVYLYLLYKRNIGRFANRLPEFITDEKIKYWMDLMKPSLNTAASSDDYFGVVCYPK